MKPSTGFVPDRGDIVWLSFDPQSGHEQASHRPALVLSPKAYNQAPSLALMCPITSRVKGYPFETALPKSVKVAGVILADQVKASTGAPAKQPMPPPPPRPWLKMFWRSWGFWWGDCPLQIAASLVARFERLSPIEGASSYHGYVPNLGFVHAISYEDLIHNAKLRHEEFFRVLGLNN